MSGPFKLKYKNSAFPFRTDEKITIKKMKIHPEAPEEPLSDRLEKFSKFKEKEKEERTREKEFWRPKYKYKKIKKGEGHNWDTEA